MAPSRPGSKSSHHHVPASDPAHDRLFGLLALQTGVIDQGALFAAFAAWTRDKARSLADHLVNLGHLDAPRRAAVEAVEVQPEQSSWHRQLADNVRFRGLARLGLSDLAGAAADTRRARAVL